MRRIKGPDKYYCTCGHCGDGGDLMCCEGEGCAEVVHCECAGFVEALPHPPSPEPFSPLHLWEMPAEWFCLACEERRAGPPQKGESHYERCQYCSEGGELLCCE